MEPFPFTFTIDSSGSPDAITLPQDFPSGIVSLKLKPPTGHAWTFYGPGSTYFALDTDEALEIPPSFHQAGEVIGKGALDSGTGTMRGIAFNCGR